MSRRQLENCHSDISWMQAPDRREWPVSLMSKPWYCQGHKTRRGAHRIVSGIVRASLKENLRSKFSPLTVPVLARW